VLQLCVKLAWISNNCLSFPEYVISYQAQIDEPTFTFPIISVTVSSSERETTISGLAAYTVYKVKVAAHNSIGSVSSGWVELSTGESAPSNLRLIQSEPRANGRSILLKWLPPG